MYKIFTYVFIIGLTSLLASCQPKKERTFFHLAYVSPMATTNSVLATDLTAYNFLHNVHEGLMTYSIDGHIIYGLLEDMTMSEDGLTYQLSLRPDLFFSDGSPLTMYEVLASWMYVLDTRTHAPFAHLFDVIQGAKAYREGETREISGITVVSDRVMMIELVNPFFFFLELLANPTFAILSKEWHNGQEQWQSVSGAYRFTRRDADGTLWLEPNPLHYAYDDSMLQSVQLSFLANNQVSYQLFKQGELDWLIRNVPLTLAKRDDNDRFVVKNDPNGTYFILFNHMRAPYDDIRVRKALSIALNREELAQLLEEEPRPNSYITPFSPERAVMMTDIELANKLLADAGFSEDRPLAIHYRHSASWLDRTVASYLQASWQVLTGVNVTLEAIESAQYRSLWGSGDFDLIRVSWFSSDYEDEKEFLQNFVKGNTFMQSGYHNKIFEGLLLQAENAKDLVARKEILKEAERMLLADDYAAIGLFSPYNYHLFNTDKWQGMESNGKDMHLLRYMRQRHR